MTKTSKNGTERLNHRDQMKNLTMCQRAPELMKPNFEEGRKRCEERVSLSFSLGSVSLSTFCDEFLSVLYSDNVLLPRRLEFRLQLIVTFRFLRDFPLIVNLASLRRRFPFLPTICFSLRCHREILLDQICGCHSGQIGVRVVCR